MTMTTTTTMTMTENFLEHKLQDAGGRMTPQRRAVARILQEQKGHLSAEEIHSLAQSRYPQLSLATVYRTLNRLEALGLVRELRLRGDRRRYEIEGEAQEPEHQHMVCVGCGKVIEFVCAHYQEVHSNLADRYDFVITEARVKLLGYCADCQTRLSENEERAVATRRHQDPQN